MSGIRKDEIVIEIDHPKNSDVFFHPIGRSLRSKWITQRSGSRAQGPLNAFTMQSIPGLRIHLCMKHRYGRISDPLGDPEHKETMALINRVSKQLNPPRAESKPHDDEEFKALDEILQLSWLYYMMSLVEGRRVNIPNPTAENGISHEQRPWAELIAGEFPYKDPIEVRQTGKVLTFNPSPIRGEPRFLEPLPPQDLEFYQQKVPQAG
jgi:hypothetical protein